MFYTTVENFILNASLKIGGTECLVTCDVELEVENGNYKIVKLSHIFIEEDGPIRTSAIKDEILALVKEESNRVFALAKEVENE